MVDCQDQRGHCCPAGGHSPGKAAGLLTCQIRRLARTMLSAVTNCSACQQCVLPKVNFARASCVCAALKPLQSSTSRRPPSGARRGAAVGRSARHLRLRGLWSVDGSGGGQSRAGFFAGRLVQLLFDRVSGPHPTVTPVKAGPPGLGDLATSHGRLGSLVCLSCGHA